nr:hypothetical protein [Bacillus swezeyi]
MHELLSSYKQALKQTETAYKRLGGDQENDKKLIRGMFQIYNTPLSGWKDGECQGCGARLSEIQG